MARTYGKAQDLIDFTRASSGTALRRVKYGAELVTNGTFSDGGTGWNQLLSYDLPDFTGGVATIVATPTYIYQDLDFTAGNLYEITYDVVTAGSSMALSGSGAFGSVVLATTEGTHTYRLICTNASGYFQIFFGATGLVVDNISVKEVTFDTSDGDLILFNHPNNIPRIEYDANGNRLGLLVEESRANLITYSEDFSNAAWAKAASTILSDQISSPDRSTNADLLSEVDVDLHHSSHFPVSVSVGSDYTFSAYVKKQNRRYVAIGFIYNTYYGTAVQYDLDSGSVAYSASVGAGYSITNSGIENVGNGWYRVWVTGTFGHTTGFPAIASGGDTQWSTGNIHSNTFVGDTAKGVYIYGAQLEAGSFPTSYIPTSGSTATRSADVASIGVSEFGFNSAESTVVVDYQTATSEGITRIAELESDGNNRITLFNGGLSEIAQLFINVSGVTQADFTTPNSTVSGSNKIAFIFKQDDVSIVLNGGTVASDTSANIPTVDTLLLGYSNAAGRLNGHIKSLKYYPRALTATQIQELTS